MSQDMEQIEARLAGYVDGTLPPDQRAEIEAYLAANPTHGRLITELKSIKAAVGNLPRDKAPAEVMDAIQSQLERHVLLDGVEDHGGPTRINRWPQLGAVAAMLLLVGGLGLLVYQVLPREKSNDAGLALLPSSTRGIGTDADLPDAAPVVLDATPAPTPAMQAVPGGGAASAAVTRPPPLDEMAGGLIPKPAQSFRQMAANSLPGQNDRAAPLATPAATAPSDGQIASVVVTPDGTLRMAAPTAGESDRSAAGVATTQRRDSTDGVKDVETSAAFLVIETADPGMTRNLIAATLAAAGHSTAAGDLKADAPPAASQPMVSRPSDELSGGATQPAAVAVRGAALLKTQSMPPSRAAVGDVYLVVTGLQLADIERLRTAASASGASAMATSAVPAAPTTGPAKTWVLVFHATPPSSAAAAAVLPPATTAAAATASRRTPATSPVLPPAPQEMP